MARILALAVNFEMLIANKNFKKNHIGMLQIDANTSKASKSGSGGNAMNFVTSDCCCKFRNAVIMTQHISSIPHFGPNRFSFILKSHAF